MAWTAPMTAVTNAVFTASEFNTHVRDNLLETAPGKASAEGQYFVATAANAVAPRTSVTAYVQASQTTSSTSYTNLSTVGPTVTATTGTRALVLITCDISNTDDAYSVASFEVTGATTVAANDDNAIHYRDSASAAHSVRSTSHTLLTSLNPGSHTFTMKYKVLSGTGHFGRRRITVVPF